MTHTPTTPRHTEPTSLLTAIRTLRAAAISCANDPTWSTPDDDVLTAIAEAHAAQQAVTALLLHLIQQADNRSLTKIKRRAGTSSWLASELRITVPAARRLTKRARQVCARPRLAAALRNGQVNADQAGAIAHTVHDLPDTIDAARADAAETMLIAEAGRLDAHRLAQSTDHILDILDPDGAGARETVRRHRETGPVRRLSITAAPQGDGIRLNGTLDASSAAVLEAALSRHGAPPTPAPPAPGNTPTTAERRADALIAVCRLSLATTPATRSTPATADDRRRPPADPPAGVVIPLADPHARLKGRPARKRSKAAHHASAKNGRTRHPARR